MITNNFQIQKSDLFKTSFDEVEIPELAISGSNVLDH